MMDRVLLLTAPDGRTRRYPLRPGDAVRPSYEIDGTTWIPLLCTTTTAPVTPAPAEVSAA